jgi:hypothetical protein
MPEPGLRPSTGITRLPRYNGPLRLPQRPEAGHFRPPRLMAATHHRHGSHTLPQRPSAHADSTTPAGEGEISGRLLPAPQRPSPSGRRVGSSEKLSRPTQSSRDFRPAHLHLGCTEDFPRGFSGRSLASTAPVATGRTDNSPDGTSTRWSSRPRRSLRNLKLSSRQTSFRVALPGT